MIKRYDDGKTFIIDNFTFLDENKYLSVFFYFDAELLIKTDSNNYAIKVEEDNKKLLALKVEPYNLLLYGDKECLKELLNYLNENKLNYDNIMCACDIGDCLLEDNKYELFLGMDFMAAHEYTEETSTNVISANIDDLDEIFACVNYFIKDCHLADIPNIDKIRNNINNYRIIKENNMIISMASYSNDTDISYRITNVYTRPEYRGMGYGRKVVNAIKNEILDKGMIATLNVDKKNSISNHLYNKLGFKKVFSQGVYNIRK